MPRKQTSDTVSAGRSSMPDSIKAIAAELLIAHGYHGMNFRSIAEQLDITTTNIHYHFGNKQRLVDEVVQDYVADATARHRAIWLDEKTTLADKLRRVVDYNYERYKRFNRGKHTGQPWSLIGRLRLESNVLSDMARASLASFTTSVHDAIRLAVEMAWQKGELRPDTPREDLAFLIINIVNSSSVFTQDAGSFERLELFFEAFVRVMLSAYAADPKPADPIAVGAIPAASAAASGAAVDVATAGSAESASAPALARTSRTRRAKKA